MEDKDLSAMVDAAREEDAITEDDLRIESLAGAPKIEYPDVYPVAITTDTDRDGEQGCVALYWDREENKLKIKCTNATIEEGAQKFFEYMRDHFGTWIVEQIEAAEEVAKDTCQYCGR
jgi:hypothetical protein